MTPTSFAHALRTQRAAALRLLVEAKVDEWHNAGREAAIAEILRWLDQGLHLDDDTTLCDLAHGARYLRIEDEAGAPAAGPVAQLHRSIECYRCWSNGTWDIDYLRVPAVTPADELAAAIQRAAAAIDWSGQPHQLVHIGLHDAPPAAAPHRTADSLHVERHLRSKGFARVAAYRFNPASLRVRIIDPVFTGLTDAQRHDLVAPALAELPAHLQGDIVFVLLRAPEEPGDARDRQFEDYRA